MNKNKEKEKYTSAEKYFIKKNKLTGKTEEEIDGILKSLRVSYNGEIPGLGTLFNEWCEKKGRAKPPDNLIEALNLREVNPWILIKEAIVDHPTLWVNWCTFFYGKGSFHV